MAFKTNRPPLSPFFQCKNRASRPFEYPGAGHRSRASSKLEGNTDSRLDTQGLITRGQFADDKDALPVAGVDLPRFMALFLEGYKTPNACNAMRSGNRRQVFEDWKGRQ